MFFFFFAFLINVYLNLLSGFRKHFTDKQKICVGTTIKLLFLSILQTLTVIETVLLMASMLHCQAIRFLVQKMFEWRKKYGIIVQVHVKCYFTWKVLHKKNAFSYGLGKKERKKDLRWRYPAVGHFSFSNFFKLLLAEIWKNKNNGLKEW